MESLAYEGIKKALWYVAGIATGALLMLLGSIIYDRRCTKAEKAAQAAE